MDVFLISGKTEFVNLWREKDEKEKIWRTGNVDNVAEMHLPIFFASFSALVRNDFFSNKKFRGLSKYFDRSFFFNYQKNSFSIKKQFDLYQ